MHSNDATVLSYPIYLDNNATTPCDPRVLEAMMPYFSRHFGNAASHGHLLGWEAEAAVDKAREQVASLIGADPGEIFFTSGATESDNLAIKGTFEKYGTGASPSGRRSRHIITCAIEHRAVLDTCRHLEKIGADLTYLEVTPEGLIDLAALEAAIRPDTMLIAIMYANNETGTLLPVRQIGAMAKNKGILFFSDAAQAVGKIPVNIEADGVDLLAISGHKMYGPKGVGALYIRRKDPRVTLVAQMDGGGHEKGIRSGTLNVPGIVGLGKACEIAETECGAESARLNLLRNKLEAGLLKVEGASVNGSVEFRLPHVTNISFSHTDADDLMMDFNRELALSTGSACSSATPEPSHVLKALGKLDELTKGSLRFGLGRYTTEEEINFVIDRVTASVHKAREASPVWEMYKEGIDLS